MKSEQLLRYMELADPAFVEEASDRNVMLYRKRRKRTAWAACACIAVVLLVGAVFAEPAVNAWNLRNTVISWPSPALPGASVKPSSGVYVSAELPTRGKLDADAPFTLSVGLGQATSYEYATLTVNAQGFEITDKDGNTARDRYVRTLSDFNSGDYGMNYNNLRNVTGCAYLEDFTFRYMGGDGEGSISISLLSRSESGSDGDSVSLYYTVANGALKLTDKRPTDTQGNGVTLEEETAQGEVSLSKEDISVQVQMDSCVLTPGQYLGGSVEITARHKTDLAEYPTAGFTAELVYAETLREEDYSFVIKKPIELDVNGGMFLALSPRVPTDAPVGAYDLRVTDPETGFVWIFENMAWVQPADIPAYEDFVCEVTATKSSLMQGEYFFGGDIDVFTFTLTRENGDDLSFLCRADLVYAGEEDVTCSIGMKASAAMSFFPPAYIPADAPVGYYDLVVTDDLYGYTWRFEDFIKITEDPDAERFTFSHNIEDVL
ncbi:MAG: hypothetical protein IJX72_00720, partial [Clostridia bacterium]|nr:hypothetical protein [Clostridia bacterium]